MAHQLTSVNVVPSSSPSLPPSLLAAPCAFQGSPVFLYIGGEGPLSPRSVGHGTFVNYLASKHKAMVVALEHRYFGKSYPTSDMSNENLRSFLSSDQALADLARFRNWFAANISSDVDSRWIPFGGSYPGNLAAWVQLKYPHLFAGSIASSAPVEAIANWPGYMQVVGDGLLHFGGQGCHDRVRTAAETLAAKLPGAAGASSADFAAVNSMFDICKGSELSSSSTPEDVATFQSTVMGTLQGIVQYNQIIPRSVTVSDVCTFFSKTDGSGDDLVNRLAFLTLNASKVNGTQECVDASYADTVAQLSISEFDGTSASRQWFFMTCLEFGYFQVAAGPFKSFASTLNENYYNKICADVFGLSDVYPVTSWTNTDRGARQIAASNVTYPSGTIDPWHVLGITNSTKLHNPTERAVFIGGTAHCADMYRPAPPCEDPVIQEGGFLCEPANITWAHDRISEEVTWVTLSKKKLIKKKY